MPLLIDGNYPQAHTRRSRPVEPGSRVGTPAPRAWIATSRDIAVRYPQMDLSSWRERFPLEQSHTTADLRVRGPLVLHQKMFCLLDGSTHPSPAL
jgi:hypothetical protein